MAYQALYRKWRPLIFDDVVGQEHITTTLKNELMNGKVGHAYLFCGTRGTGKTSTAKILARAINCLNPQNGNPCNECDACRGIMEESVLDVMEMDAASNTGVDDIRRIIEDSMFSPSSAKKKVYIIDEVHMISTSAFNALLKTLEEPPEYVVFILATTEYHKLPATVLSRCQRFDFRRITTEDIAGRLGYIAGQEGFDIDKDGLNLIAELGDGSMRDALSTLDGCLAYTDGKLTYEDIVKIVGIADNDALFEMCGAIFKNDGCRAIEMLSQVIAEGRDVRAFVELLVKYLRDVFIVKLTKYPNRILNTTGRKLDQLKQLADEFSQAKLTFALDQLNSAVNQAKGSVFSTTIFELAVIKVCDSSLDDSRESLIDRVSVLEQKLEHGATAESAPQKPIPSEPLKQPSAPAPKPEAKQAEPKTAPAPLGKASPAVAAAIQKWDDIKLYLRSHGGLPISAHFADVQLKDVHGNLGIIFPDAKALNRNLVNRAGNLELIRAAVEAVTGQAADVKCLLRKELGDQDDTPAADPLDQLKKQFPDIQIIEE